MELVRALIRRDRTLDGMREFETKTMNFNENMSNSVMLIPGVSSPIGAANTSPEVIDEAGTRQSGTDTGGVGGHEAGMLSRSLGMPSRKNGPANYLGHTWYIVKRFFANPTASSSAPFPQESNP